jgi:hypothetical protein
MLTSIRQNVLLETEKVTSKLVQKVDGLPHSDDRPERSYWPRLVILDVVVDLSHLEPFILACPTTVRESALRINVRFSNHCFSEEFREEVHAEGLVVMDRKRKRAFDRVRYNLSRNLPQLIRQLPGAKVHQTFEQRNYVYAASVVDLEGHVYEVYFTLRRADGGVDLHLFVESAYAVEQAAPRSKRPNAIRFKVLAAKIFKGEKVRFAPR